MNNKLIPIVLALVVGTILAGSVMMPVLNDAVATSDTYTNKGLFYVDENTESLHYTYENKVLKLNDEVITFPGDMSEGTTVIYTDNLIVRAYTNDMRFRGLYDYNASSFDITIADGVLSGNVYTSTNHSISMTISDHFYGVTNKDTGVVMAPVSDAPYLKTSTVMSTAPLIHPTEIGNSNTYMILYMKGSIDEGLEFTLLDIHYGTVLTDFTVSDYVIDYTPVEGHVGLYKLNSITITLSTVPDEGETALTTDRTISNVALDETQTAERTNHLTPGQIALVSAIPVMVIIALLMVAVGVVARRND